VKSKAESKNSGDASQILASVQVVMSLSGWAGKGIKIQTKAAFVAIGQVLVLAKADWHLSSIIRNVYMHAYAIMYLARIYYTTYDYVSILQR